MLQLPMQIQGNIRAITSRTTLKGTVIGPFYVIPTAPPYFPPALLSIQPHPVLLSFFQLIQLFCENLVAFSILIDLGLHRLMEVFGLLQLLVVHLPWSFWVHLILVIFR